MNTTESLLQLIEASPSPFHTVAASAQRLAAAGFTALDWGKSWQLEEHKAYYTIIYGSTLLAFRTGNTSQLKIAAAHTDFPGFRIKPAPEIAKDGYGVLNIEGYGGAILPTWQDRPLGIAGKVVVADGDSFKAILWRSKDPLLTIPSLAIHMNRKVNEGVALNKQKDLLPLATLADSANGHKEFFASYLAQSLGCSRADIMAYELNLYPTENGQTLGLKKEFISSPRLDNITSVEACLKGIIHSENNDSLSIIALFDNEEIGSRTKQGAASAVLMHLLERIYNSLGKNREDLLVAIANGFMLSVDVAHGIHPNYPDKCDPTSRPVLNGGVVLKQAASQSYAGDAEAIATIKSLCRRHGIPCQQFVNRSDMAGGSTLGSIASALVPLRTMDIGVPILAMHSARETMGAADQSALNHLLQAFFS